MLSGQASRTALSVAAHRAAHQILEGGRVFLDPLAVPIVGRDRDSIAQDAQQNPFSRRMRLFIAARSRFAEDACAAALGAGASQVVILGAGLDTYAYRSPVRPGVRVFEVDHPATQAWKRDRLAAAHIPVPGSLTFAPVDFERQRLEEGLAAAGFDPGRQTFFTWLGVVPYLTLEAIWSTLGFIEALANGSGVVFDYHNPPGTLSADKRAAHEARAARVSQLGEAWLSYFDTGALHGQLRALGFEVVEDLGPSQVRSRYFGLSAESDEQGAHLIHAVATDGRA